MKQLVLASKSPRRREILQKAGLNFVIKDSDYEEELSDKIFTYEKIETLAKNKAFGALKHIKNPAYIISADTVVVHKNTILTKPSDKNEAYSTLRQLSGETHIVVTGLCILDSETQKYIINSTTTNVEFYPLTEEMIIKYIDEFNPMDKAGAYGIQELPEGYVKNVSGDIENVIGLSTKAVMDSIKELEATLEESPTKSSYPQD